MPHGCAPPAQAPGAADPVQDGGFNCGAPSARRKWRSVNVVPDCALTWVAIWCWGKQLTSAKGEDETCT